jgi:hypothetical protein
MSSEIASPSAEATLLSYYNFNMTTGTALPDVKNNTVTGLLTGFALTGSTSNWVASVVGITPTTIAATNINTTTFTANWTAPSGVTVTSYKLDVSTSPTFATLVTGFNNLDVGNFLTRSVTGLSVNVTYYYRVRAVTSPTGQITSSSNVTTTQTSTPGAPILAASTGVSATGYTANWSAVSGADSYQLDVSTSPTFASFVSGYNNLSVAGTSRAIIGLNAGSTYYFQVRAVQDGVPSANSGTGTAYTKMAFAPNNALNFDGIDDNVNLGASAFTPGTGSFTVEMWFNSANIGTRSYPCIMSNKDWVVAGGSTQGFVFSIDAGTTSVTNTKTKLMVNAGDGSNRIDLNSNKAVQYRWHRLCYL